MVAGLTAIGAPSSLSHTPTSTIHSTYCAAFAKTDDLHLNVPSGVTCLLFLPFGIADNRPKNSGMTKAELEDAVAGVQDGQSCLGVGSFGYICVASLT